MTADDFRRFDEFGYVVLPDHRTISRDALSHLETLFERAGENAGHTLRDEPFARVLDIPPVEAGIFADLTNDVEVLEFVRHRLGVGFELTALHARSLSPFATASGSHGPPPNPSTCQVLWLLDGFRDEGTAALRVIPRSHLAASGTTFDESALVAVKAAAGSAIVFDGRLWAASGVNSGSRHLRMLRCGYARSGADP